MFFKLQYQYAQENTPPQSVFNTRPQPSKKSSHLIINNCHVPYNFCILGSLSSILVFSFPNLYSQEIVPLCPTIPTQFAFKGSPTRTVFLIRLHLFDGIVMDGGTFARSLSEGEIFLIQYCSWNHLTNTT